MSNCPCQTKDGRPCDKRPRPDSPFCGAHTNQILAVQGTSIFKRSRVLRGSFSSVDPTTIADFLEKWSEAGHPLPRSTAIESHITLILSIIEKRGPITVGALTDCLNAVLNLRFSPTQMGRCLQRKVRSGEVIKWSTRSAKATIHKTTVYSLPETH